MIEIKELIDYKFIKLKKEFNQRLSERLNGTNVIIGIEYFNLDLVYQEEFNELVIKNEQIEKNSVSKSLNNISILMKNLKEYLAVREILVDKKEIKTTNYIYRLL